MHVESLSGATSPLENSSKHGSQMALLSYSKRGDNKACGPGEGGGTFSFLTRLVLASSVPSASASRRPDTRSSAPRVADRFDGS